MSGWVVLPRVLNQFGRVVQRSRIVRAPGRVSFRSGLGTVGKIPRIFSVQGRTKVMPRMFRRGYGLGGGLTRFRKRRAFGKRRVGKKTQNKVHSFVRWCDKDTQFGSNSPAGSISETGSDQHQSYEFRFSNLTNVTDFTNLYDMYRINKIQLMLEPQFTSNGQFYNNLNILSKKIRVVHDYNSNNVLANEDDYLEYSNCKSYSATRQIKITLYPKVNNTVEGNGGAPAYTSLNANKLWLNISNADVPHFGIKAFIPEDISNTEGVLLFKVRAKYWISLKNSK